MNTPTTCNVCNSRPAWRGHACRTCYAVDLALTFILGKWELAEVPALAESLREAGTIGNYTDNARNRGAGLAHELGSVLGRLRFVARDWPQESGFFLRSLAKRLEIIDAGHKQLVEDHGSMDNYRAKIAAALARAEGAALR